MESGQMVTVTVQGPREKFWGVLLDLNATGLTVRGIPLDAFEDFLHQVAGATAELLGPSTVFLPAHRLERVELDESVGAVEGLGDRFRRLTGRDPRQELLGSDPSVDSRRQM